MNATGAFEHRRDELGLLQSRPTTADGPAPAAVPDDVVVQSFVESVREGGCV
jgi:hypothetical protein